MIRRIWFGMVALVMVTSVVALVLAILNAKTKNAKAAYRDNSSKMERKIRREVRVTNVDPIYESFENLAYSSHLQIIRKDIYALVHSAKIRTRKHAGGENDPLVAAESAITGVSVIEGYYDQWVGAPPSTIREEDRPTEQDKTRFLSALGKWKALLAALEKQEKDGLAAHLEGKEWEATKVSLESLEK